MAGEIVLMSPTGGLPSSAAAAIYRSLWDYQPRTRSARAYTDNTGFLVDLPQRKSFSPDASFYVGPPPGPKFLEGAPIFAAEVRSEDDYGTRRRESHGGQARRLLRGRNTGRAGRRRPPRGADPGLSREAPDTPTLYRRGERAEAEPALPGWSFPVDDIFE